MSSRLPAFGLCGLMLYFAFNAFAGESGLGHLSDLQRKLDERRAELDVLETDIAALETDIARLSPGSIDPDLVERLARENLAYVYPEEYILVEVSR